jgi:hypothetical protein
MIPWPSLFATRRMAAVGADLPLLRRSTNDEVCPIAAIEEQLGGRVIALKRFVGRLR